MQSVMPECPSGFLESRRDLVLFHGTDFYRASSKETWIPAKGMSGGSFGREDALPKYAEIQIKTNTPCHFL